MRHPSTTLTEAELEIMQGVWKLGSTAVREVYEALRERRTVAYTSVMTMMGILEQKGHLRRQRSERAYVYQPAKPRSQVVGAMVRDFVDRVFQGAAKPLVVHLVEDRHLSRKDLD